MSLAAQNPTKNTGFPHYGGAPGNTPNEQFGAEIGYDYDSQQIYVWNRDSSAWQLAVTDVSFDTTGLRNNVYPITTVADTATIPNPTEGDFFVKDSTTFGVYGGDQWYIIFGGGGAGGGGPVSWNDLIDLPEDFADSIDNGIDAVATDEMLGDGTPQNPLRFYLYFKNDIDAAAGGVPIGGIYRAALGNEYGIRYGALITRIE